MGYHSADYDHDWKIGVAELARVTALYDTVYSGDGNRSGCYKVSPHSIDGFAPDTYRDPSLPVVLSSYHSADFNQDGKIDEAELNRVTFLYDTEVDFVRTGDYRPSPDSVDGFAQYSESVLLSHYQFDEDHPPVISSHNTFTVDATHTYKLRALFDDGSEEGFQSINEPANNGLALTNLPAPGSYSVVLYWVKYIYVAGVWQIEHLGPSITVSVQISPAVVDRDPTACSQCEYSDSPDSVAVYTSAGPSDPDYWQDEDFAAILDSADDEILT
jgi:hypothetical protein